MKAAGIADWVILPPAGNGLSAQIPIYLARSGPDQLSAKLQISRRRTTGRREIRMRRRKLPTLSTGACLSLRNASSSSSNDLFSGAANCSKNNAETPCQVRSMTIVPTVSGRTYKRAQGNGR